MKSRQGDRPTRIAHLTSVHGRFDSRIFHKECLSLRDAGFDVTLVAPGDADATVNGIRIVTVPFPSLRTTRLLRTVPSLLGVALRLRADVYHLHDPELLPVGFMLSLLTRAKVVWDAHEEITHFAERPWIHRRLRGLVERLVVVVQRVTVGRFDAVVGATPKILEPFPPEKRVLVQNYPRLDEWDVAAPPFESRPARACYVGDLTVARGARDMVEAMAVAGPAGARLALAGRFNPPALEAEAAALDGWPFIDFLGYVDRPSVVATVTHSRVGVLLLHPLRNYQMAQPIKIFEYMAAGIPIVAYDLPWVGELLRRHRCGVVTRPLDPVEAGQAIAELVADDGRAAELGERARHAVRRYAWEDEAKALVAMYERLTAIASS